MKSIYAALLCLITMAGCHTEAINPAYALDYGSCYSKVGTALRLEGQPDSLVQIEEHIVEWEYYNNSSPYGPTWKLIIFYGVAANCVIYVSENPPSP